ncbi:MAG: non-hydrolyzing UDP-N-acetylglucosamine 2-epimerase [Thermomicrobiales bacterium]
MASARPRLITILGTRPEIIKCSPLLPLFDQRYEHTLVHTGQHYDDTMDARFFRELGLRAPDHTLGVGSGPPASQVARMLTGLEPILQVGMPDWVFVQGDTNSTLAGALAAAKLGYRVVHLEAGCRSFNRAMPEETNRVLVDHIADLCLAPDTAAAAHLAAEGIAAERIVIVGSTAVDACLRVTTLATPSRPIRPAPGPAVRDGYLVATIHRAENTTPARLAGLLGALADLSVRWPVLFPVHPRTAAVMRDLDLSLPVRVRCCEPLGYAQMMRTIQASRGLLTDSGGLQEEAAVLGVPTFILRQETEWRELVESGHHRLVGADRAAIVAAVEEAFDGGPREAAMRAPVGRERAGAPARVLAALAAWDGMAAAQELVPPAARTPLALV